MKKRFEIRRTPEIEALCGKYEDYRKDYIPGEEEEDIYKVFDRISEWERVVLYALTEYKSTLRFAHFFGITEWAAKQTIREIREKMQDLLKTK